MVASTTTYEPIMTALFALLNSRLVPGVFRFTSRRLIMWEELVNLIQNGMPIPFVQPAMFLYDGMGFGGGITEFEDRGRGMGPKRVLKRTIVVYAQLPGSGTPGGFDFTTAPGSIFAPLSEEIEAVFNTPDFDGAVLTLGGLVSRVYITGTSHWVTADISPTGQGMMTVPISIIIP